MRVHGTVTSAGGLGLQDHVCWTYEDDEEFRAAALEFVADGLRLGQRVMYAGPWPVDKLLADLEVMPGLPELVREGTVEVASLDRLRRPDGRTDAGGLLGAFRSATDRALSEGRAGLRVVGEVTPFLTDAANWAPHARWESLADRYMAGHPLALLCCYDRRRLERRPVSDVAAVHPCVHVPSDLAPFRLWSTADGWALEGEVDFFAAGDLRRTLELAPVPGEEAVLDLSALGFIDHHGLLVLRTYASSLAARGCRLAFRDAPPLVARVAELLGMPIGGPR